MTAREMLEMCRLRRESFINLARTTGLDIYKRDCLYEAQFYGNMEELLEDVIYNGGKHTEFLISAFEEREKEYLSCLLPDSPERTNERRRLQEFLNEPQNTAKSMTGVVHECDTQNPSTSTRLPN